MKKITTISVIVSFLAGILYLVSMIPRNKVSFTISGAVGSKNRRVTSITHNGKVVYKEGD